MACLGAPCGERAVSFHKLIPQVCVSVRSFLQWTMTIESLHFFFFLTCSYEMSKSSRKCQTWIMCLRKGKVSSQMLSGILSRFPGHLGFKQVRIESQDT